jgi:type IV pilus assembly protein PilY1
MFTSHDKHMVLVTISSRQQWCHRIIGFCALIAGILFMAVLPARGDIQLATEPLFTRVNPPPTNLMFLLDDSGSMTFEILYKGGYDGKFPNPERGETDGFAYYFDYFSDGYPFGLPQRRMDKDDRKYWRTQWHAVNVIYYNPAVIYEPWPSYDGKTFGPADTEAPLTHPLSTQTLKLDEEAYKVGAVEIPWAHYFVESTDDGIVYLVILDEDDGINKYYTFTTDGGTEPNDKIKSLTRVSEPPDDIVRDHDQDIQNFANWFTYHHRREFVAKAAIAQVFSNPDLTEARMGILGINDRVIVPLKPVRAVIGGEFKDETDALLESLYDYISRGGTPLKGGLETVGSYYQKNDGELQGKTGDPPYPAGSGACQQSFTLVVTDGYYSDQESTFKGNIDGSGSDPYGDFGGGSAPYSDKFKDSLADMAMYYYATDLLPEVDNKVPANRWDSATHQHMVTFAVAFGVSGTLDPDDYEDNRNNPNYMRYITQKEEPREYGDYVIWPEVKGDREAESIDDLWHATVNGRGVFINAGEGEKLVEGLRRVIEDIQSRRPTAVAALSVNGDPLFGVINSETVLFQSSYAHEDDFWFGDVKAYRLDPFTGAVIFDPVVWSAAEKLRDTPWQTRNILTSDGDNSGQEFIFSDLNSDQKEKLGSNPDDVVNFVRGRDPVSGDNRINILADVVNSAPVFSEEEEVVYFGANGGMLHAVDAKTGSELFAYVPYLVFDHLKDLADSDYEHSFYVDATPTVVQGNKLLGKTGNQVILVCGLGAGGRGYFALDVTQPKNMTKNEVLWEFPDKNTTSENLNDIGYSYSRPVVVNTRSQTYPWIVIVGNGYNSPNGNSVLFILNAADGAVIGKIEAGIGPDNGLSSPIAVDVDFDEIVDFVYAGDLKGNLWKFDFTSDNPLDWGVAFNDGTLPAALFSATDPFGNPQPITTRPDVMLHPVKRGLIVCFGTGRLLSSSDLARTQIQTLYGIWDYGDRGSVGVDLWSDDDNREFLGTFVSRDRKEIMLSSAYLSDKVKLAGQTATDYQVEIDGREETVRLLTANRPIWDTMADPDGNDQLPDPSNSNVNDAGWYLDLDVYAGERIVSDVLLRDGILITVGFIPTEEDCDSGGNSVVMELDAFTGGTIGSIQFDLNEDGLVGEDDKVKIVIDGKITEVPPSGYMEPGLVQGPPVIQKLREGATEEIKYFTSTSRGIAAYTERSARVGISYWMELRD